MGMNRAQISHFHRMAGVAAIFAVIGVFAGIVLSGGDTGQISSVSERRPTGSPQLISVEPLPSRISVPNIFFQRW